MFCSKCGKQNAANAKFCNTCGTAVVGNSANQQPARKSPKPINKALFAILAVVLVVVVAGVFLLNDNALSGIYVFDSDNPQFSGGFNNGDIVMWGDNVYRDSSISIAFLSGNRFTITDYRMRAFPDLQSPSGLPGGMRARNVETPRLPFWNDRTVFNSEQADPGLWLSTINGVRSMLVRRTSDGTFSVSDGQIEFVHSDGSIEVLRFEQTLNAITISGIRFYRQ